ncbi:MAG: tyrosine-type recombinase/integrase [Thiohalorhabdus sp.]
MSTRSNGTPGSGGGHRKGRLYQRSGSAKIYAQWYDAEGKLRRCSTGTEDWEEAEALLRQWEQEAFLGRHFGVAPARLFDELMVAFLDEAGPERDQERDLYSLRQLHPEFSGRNLQEVTTQDVLGYVRRRRSEGAAAATVNREIGLLSVAINHANLYWGWELPNPAQGCREAEPEGRVRWITRAEARRLIEAARERKRAPYLADYIQLGLYTGMRRREILELEWRRVDLKRGVILLEAEHNKGRRRRTVPINRAAREALINRRRWLAEHAPGSRWVFANRQGERIADPKKAFAAAVAAAGLEDFTPHDMRHTFASWLVMEGVDLYRVRDLLGHRSITQTERYAHLAPHRIAEAAAVLDGEDGAELHSFHTPAQGGDLLESVKV